MHDSAFVVTAVASGREPVDGFIAANPAIRVTRAVLANAQEVDRHTLMVDRVIAPDNRYDRAALAQALIHASIWRDCAGSQTLTHVADSRLVMRERFAELIAPHAAAAEAFDVLVWAYDLCEPVDVGLAAGIDGRLIHNTTNPSSETAAFRRDATGSLAFRLRSCGAPFGYTLSPGGARKLLALCLPFRSAPVVYFPETNQPCSSAGFHVAMAGHYVVLKAFVLHPVLAVAPPDPARSFAMRHFLEAYNAFAVAHARATPIHWKA